MIGNINSINKIFEVLKNKNIKLDGLVNNAGINLPNKFNKISLDDYDTVLNINIRAPFFYYKNYCL